MTTQPISASSNGGSPVPPGPEIGLVARLPEYREHVDDAINTFCVQQTESVIPDLESQHAHPAVLASRHALLDLIARPDSRRARGILAMASYELYGGTNLKIAALGALAVELVQAGALPHDDVQDKSSTRRGGPSVHTLLADQSSRHGWSDDPQHHGMSLAIDAGTIASHEARNVINRIDPADVAPEISSRVSLLIGETIVSTASGQDADLSLRATDQPPLEQILYAIRAKTADYTIRMPLEVGMLLAGADPSHLGELKEFSDNAGIAFQMLNDLYVIERNDPSDIRTNKATLLMHHVLEADLPARNREFLTAMLGNKTISDENFARCQQIIRDSGAADRVREEAQQRIKHAKRSLPKDLKSLGSLADLLMKS